MRADEQEPDMRPTVEGEEASDDEAYPLSALVVNPAVVHRRRSNLPREICGMSRNRDWGWSDSSWPCRRSQQRAK